MTSTFLDRLGLTMPLVQAPMAGVSTPELAAAVSNEGALGSIGVGATDATGARAIIEEVCARTDRSFNVNLFVRKSAVPDAARETAWLDWLAPLLRKLRCGAAQRPPHALQKRRW